MHRGDKLTIEMLRPYRRILARRSSGPDWYRNALVELVILEIALDNSAILIKCGRTDGKPGWWTDQGLAAWEFYTGLEAT